MAERLLKTVELVSRDDNVLGALSPTGNVLSGESIVFLSSSLSLSIDTNNIKTWRYGLLEAKSLMNTYAT